MSLPLRRLRLDITLLILLGAALLCAALDLGLLEWIKIGPPGSKGQLFFVELVVLMGMVVIIASASIFAPEAARTAAPFVFIFLAWHTGFQVELGSDKFVLTVFDALVPLSLFLGLIGRWYLMEGGRRTWFQDHWKLMALFWAFCMWGLILALVRNVEAPPLLANMKSLVIYPLILILIPWCIKSWRQLYLAVGFMLLLILERALDGLHQAWTHQILKFQTLLGHNVLVYRIDGDMAATNQYATYLLTGGLILLALVAASGLPKRWRAGMVVPLALIGLALLLTYSRGAWLGTGVALVALLLILRPRQAGVALGVFALIILVVQAVHPGAGSQVLARAHDYDQSIIDREEYQAIGFAVVEHYPLGAGWGAAFERTPTGVQPVPGAFPWYHDDYLQLATELGIPGLLSMVLILVSILWMGAMAARRARDATQTACLAGLTAAFLGMLVQTGTDQFLWHADIAPHIWIVAGLLAAGVSLLRRDENLRRRIEEGVRMATTETSRGRVPIGAGG